eukprot:TRINITY_DN17451_c0_g1_i1.p1 TRINITY_DN17451_c0_g1~~TRINITY_DN17451_c0_g1_i1.p1  ORF type:complete len:651 (+),score=112.01 TRINITY_DN17451_c0_g1_i1:234-2186(+)
MADPPADGGEQPAGGASSQQNAAAAYRARRRRQQVAKQRGPFVRDTASDSELPDRVRCLAYRLLIEQIPELALPSHVLLEFRLFVDSLLLDMQQEASDDLCMPVDDLDEAVRGTRWWSLLRIEKWLRPQVARWSQPVLSRLLQDRNSPALYLQPVPHSGPAPVRRFVEVSAGTLIGGRKQQEDCIGTCVHWGNYYIGPSAVPVPPHSLQEADERPLHPVLSSRHDRATSPLRVRRSGSRSSGEGSPRGRSKGSGSQRRPQRDRQSSLGSNPGGSPASPQLQRLSKPAIERWRRAAQYFCLVADGHGGTEAAVYARDFLLPHLLRSEHFPLDLTAAWRQAFAVTHSAFISRAEMAECDAGTTMLATLLWGTQLHYAWTGDSEGFVCRQGQAASLTRPHRPSDEAERRDIEARGGRVRSVGGALRVDGQVGVSRAIGARTCASHLSHEPETGSMEITSDEDFVVLATDGVWDVMRPQEVVDFIVQQRTEVDGRLRKAVLSVSEGGDSAPEQEVAAGAGIWDYSKIAEKLCQEAVGRRSSDNCSAVVAFFHHVSLFESANPVRPKQAQPAAPGPQAAPATGPPQASRGRGPSGGPPSPTAGQKWQPWHTEAYSAQSSPPAQSLGPAPTSMQSRVADVHNCYGAASPKGARGQR